MTGKKKSAASTSSSSETRKSGSRKKAQSAPAVPPSLPSTANGNASAERIIPVLREDSFTIPTKEEFFSKFSLSDEALEKCGLTWDDLVQIGRSHLERVDGLRHTANDIAERLRALESVHSVSVRIKNPAHLMEKIVRKKCFAPTREITLKTYQTEITDLIGIRVLHLFKLDWLPIHEFISTNWDFIETPKANVRAGDTPGIIEMYEKRGCEVLTHPAGYRSVHYLIESQPTKEVVVAELQVRTIFEEGWSEIDHRVRYPYDISNPVLNELLEVFNRLAGSADEMGSFVQMLKESLALRDKQAALEKASYEETVRTLKEQIATLDIDVRQKRELEKRVQELEERLAADRTPRSVVTGALNDPYGFVPGLGHLGPTGLNFSAQAVGVIGTVRSWPTSIGATGPSGPPSIIATARSGPTPNVIGVTGPTGAAERFTTLAIASMSCKTCGSAISATSPTYPYCAKCYPGNLISGFPPK